MSSYDWLELLTELQKLEIAINGLNATINLREADLVENGHLLLNRTIDYVDTILVDVRPLLEKAGPLIDSIQEGIPRFLADAEKVGIAAQAIQKTFNVLGILQLTVVFFTTAVFLIIIGAIIIIEYRRCRSPSFASKKMKKLRKTKFTPSILLEDAELEI